ncbi:MAG TPA: AMP-dependent synthetase, partial [Ruminococcaceae bacterium]|nr:AMP-dependent synthetase [Oscillospiraceae bacterium]
DIYALGAFLAQNDLTDCTAACIGANSVQWIKAYFTVLRSAGCFVPIDKELPAKDMLHLLNDSEAKVVFYDARHEDFLRENRANLPNAKLFIGFQRAEADGEFLSFAECTEAARCDEAAKAKYLACRSDPSAMKLLVYTSGTTGMSKGVMLSERNLVSSVYYGLQVSTVFEVGLSILPYNHTYECVSDLLVSFHHHSTLCINESMIAVLKNLKLYQPEYMYVVPALAEMFYARIMREMGAKGLTESFEKLVSVSNAMRKIGVDKRREQFSFIHDIFGGKLKKIVCGGAPIRPEVAEFFDNIGISLINGYGITECSPLVCANHDAANDFRTCGIKLPCIEWKIDEPNEEGIGEILVKGDIVMLGYYKNPDLTEEVLQDGWFYTGDFGYINDKEQLVISGRKKNIIVLNNGKNIYPEEIEGYIQGIDYVSEVIVSGETDENGNESTLLAEVFLNEIKTPAEVLRSIRNACKELPIYKQISKVVIRDKEFEKTSTNKIKRFKKKVKANKANESEENEPNE